MVRVLVQLLSVWDVWLLPRLPFRLITMSPEPSPPHLTSNTQA